MRLIYTLIYHPNVNRLIRNLNYMMAPVLPDRIKIHPSGTLRVPIDKQHHFYLKTNQTSFLTRELFWKNAANFEYTTLFAELIQNVTSFFDVGANIGYYSILGCTLNSGLKAYAFEPSPGVMGYLKDNIARNQMDLQIVPEAVALSDKVGTIDFFEMKNPKFSGIDNLSGEHNIGTKEARLSTKIEVPTTTMDDYIRKHDIRKLDLVKLDTEGAEHLILKGAEQTLSELRPLVICETLFNKIEKDLEAIMKRHSYEFYNHLGAGLRKVDTITRTKDNGVRNCFFVPAEKSALLRPWIV